MITYRQHCSPALGAPTLGAPALGWYYDVGRFNSLAQQSSPGLDTRKVVMFGDPKSDDLGIVTYDGAGVFTINKSGPIAIKQRIRVTRASNPGSAEVLFQAQASADGVAWVPIGTTQHEAIDEGGDTDVFLDVAFFEGVAGQKLRATWALSAPSQTDVTLDIFTPSAALQADGFEAVPSADTVLYALRNYEYT